MVHKPSFKAKRYWNFSFYLTIKKKDPFTIFKICEFDFKIVKYSMTSVILLELPTQGKMVLEINFN